ncbi:hypothetical protein JCM15060_13100 [Halanaerobaculum tunisiense]
MITDKEFGKGIFSEDDRVYKQEQLEEIYNVVMTVVTTGWDLIP